jgi:uncharacterized protein YhfF
MTAIEEYWNEFVAYYGNKNIGYTEAFAFGDNKEMADHLAQLVVEGQKQATTSAYELMAIDKDPLPKVGEYSIILNGNDEPVAVIKTIKVDIMHFNEVTSEYAEIEGEGDKSLEYWRKAHIDFFTREYKQYGKTFNENDKVVCEQFECIYGGNRKKIL